MASTSIDDAQLQALAAEGLSQYAIAKRLGLPRSTVRDRLKKLASRAPVAMSSQGRHDVHTEALHEMIPDLQELVTWWQERKASLYQTHDASRATRRVTFFVEKRWEEAIRRQSDLESLTYTQIVNDAFRRYFERK